MCEARQDYLALAMWSSRGWLTPRRVRVWGRNNRALNPHQGGGPRCASPCPCNRTACDCPGVSGCRPSGCFAKYASTSPPVSRSLPLAVSNWCCLESAGLRRSYGGQSSTFEGNEGAQCYQDAVVIFGNVG